MKNRHVKRPIEKYGKGSVSEECSRVEFERREEDNLETFYKLPYLGIFYLPEFMGREAIMRYLPLEVFENLIMKHDPTIVEHPVYGLMKKCKVKEVGHYLEFNIFNSHRYSISVGATRANDEVFLEGNILLKETQFNRL